MHRLVEAVVLPELLKLLVRDVQLHARVSADGRHLATATGSREPHAQLVDLPAGDELQDQGR